MTVRHAGASHPAGIPHEMAARPDSWKTPRHGPQPHELRRAHYRAKQFEETLEVAGRVDDVATVRAMRQQLWADLLDLERELGITP